MSAGGRPARNNAKGRKLKLKGRAQGTDASAKGVEGTRSAQNVDKMDIDSVANVSSTTKTRDRPAGTKKPPRKVEAILADSEVLAARKQSEVASNDFSAAEKSRKKLSIMILSVLIKCGEDSKEIYSAVLDAVSTALALLDVVPQAHKAFGKDRFEFALPVRTDLENTIGAALVPLLKQKLVSFNLMQSSVYKVFVTGFSVDEDKETMLLLHALLAKHCGVNAQGFYRWVDRDSGLPGTSCILGFDTPSKLLELRSTAVFSRAGKGHLIFRKFKRSSDASRAKNDYKEVKLLSDKDILDWEKGRDELRRKRNPQLDRAAKRPKVNEGGLEPLQEPLE